MSLTGRNEIKECSVAFSLNSIRSQRAVIRAQRLADDPTLHTWMKTIVCEDLTEKKLCVINKAKQQGNCENCMALKEWQQIMFIRLMVSNVYMVNINLCLPAVWEHQLWSEGRLSLWHNRRRMHPLPPQPGCMINQCISWDQHCLENVCRCEIVYWVGINYNSRKHENYVIIYSPWCSSKPVWPVFSSMEHKRR